MNGKKSRALRKANRPSGYAREVIKDKRYADTLQRKQDLALEKAEIKAEGKLHPSRHLLSRLNYKQVSR